MSRCRVVAVCLLLNLLAPLSGTTLAQTSGPTADSTAVVAGHLRTFVLEALPDPLYQDTKHWGMQKPGRKGKLKNDGRWHKLHIVGKNLAQELKLNIANLQNTPGRTVFNVNLTFPAVILLERQTWANGLRLYSGSTRARVRINIALNCEVQTKVEKTTGWIPDMVIQFKILQSNFTYDDLVVEHTAGIGGDAAKLLGEMMISLVKAARPNLDRDLSTKVNTAILKAGDAKVVRVSLTDLINGKKPISPSAPQPKK